MRILCVYFAFWCFLLDFELSHQQMPNSSRKQLEATKKALSARRKTTIKKAQNPSSAAGDSSSHQKQPKPIVKKSVVLCTDRRDGTRLAAFFRQKFVFSNFHPSPIRLVSSDGSSSPQQFHCVEQFFMYQKAVVFGDEQIARAILAEGTPSKIKGLGRRVRNFDAQQWAPLSILAMTIGTFLKYEQNEALGEELMATGDALIVEASPFDARWGIGIGMEQLKKGKPWTGQNVLGKILTAVRDKMKQDQHQQQQEAELPGSSVENSDNNQKVERAEIEQKMNLNKMGAGQPIALPEGAQSLLDLTTKKSLDIAVQIWNTL